MDEQDDEEYFNDVINDLQYSKSNDNERNYVPENIMITNTALYHGKPNILPWMKKKVCQSLTMTLLKTKKRNKVKMETAN